MNAIARTLLNWYDRNARTLPWRGIQDPYRTWVSETMLQQTRVDTVIPYYERFLARFPTLQALAAAEENEVLKLWEGLGYYSRARNLLAGARQVVSERGGVLPCDPASLQTIRGIGPYTARAIASIAFGVPVPAVDGNVIRVLSRLDGIRANPLQSSVRSGLERRAAELVPAERPGDYNQAVMDLGATVCVPGTPDCDRCPLQAFCDAFAKGDAAQLPAIPAARPPKEIRWNLYLLFSGNRVLLRRRTEKLLQGLWCFPMLQCPAEPEDPAAAAERKWRLSLDAASPVGQARHVFTHQIWIMNLYTADTAPDVPAPAGYEWIPLGAMDTLALPAAMKAAAALVRKKAACSPIVPSSKL